MKDSTKGRLCSISIFLGCFIICLVFFYRYHSLTILDTDDWNYLSFSRGMLPDSTAFNPIKVFPENFFPLVSKIAYHLFYGLVGDFASSLALGYNITISGFIAIYIWLVYKILSRKYQKVSSELLVILFFVLHFLIYRGGVLPAQYGFYSITVNNYFNYMIPTLLNYMLVFSVIYDRKFITITKHNIVWNAIFIVMAYFAIFSNLFSNEVLAIYLGVDLIFDVIQKTRKRQMHMQAIARDYIIECIVLLMWLTSMYFELHGARAGQLASTIPFDERIKETFVALLNSDINKGLFGVFIVLILLGMIIGAMKGHDGLLLKINIVWGLIALYCILLSAQVNTWYITRADVQLEFMGMLLFSVVLSLMLILCVLMQKRAVAVLLVGCVMSLAFVNGSGKTYRDANIIALAHTNGDFDAAKVVEIDNYLIEQIVNASENGEDTIELRIPCFYTGDNWPLADYGINRIPIQLYEYGVIEEPVTVTPHIDEALNYLWQ